MFASLAPPVSEEHILLHQYLDVDNLASFRVWRLLDAVLAIPPKITTLFLSLGKLMPGPSLQQHLIDTRLDGGGTAEEREIIYSVRDRRQMSSM